MSRGIIYYNRGGKCLTRLYVSVHSLRKVYKGPVTIIADKDCNTACKEMRLIAKNCQVDYLQYRFKTRIGTKTPMLNKCLMHQASPYDTTLFLDADTIVQADPSQMFDWAEAHEFSVTQFCTWKTRGKIAKRIKDWQSLYPDFVQPAIDYGPAINLGVYSFTRESTMMDNLWDYAEPGRELSFIPDETCCQLLLPQFKHHIAPETYNWSCKHSDTPREEAVVIHHHGGKHCRFDKDGQFQYNSDIWYREFQEVRHCIPQDWIQADRQLRQNLPIWDKLCSN